MISWPPALESIQPVRRAVNSQKLSLPDTPHSCTRPLNFLWYAVTTYNHSSTFRWRLRYLPEHWMRNYWVALRQRFLSLR